METVTSGASKQPPDINCGFAGTLKNIQLTDLIQMCCISASSLCIRITKGDHRGTIFIVEGEIVHAVCENLEGEEAFYRILGWQTGSFKSIEVAPTLERTIQKNYHFLIMEAARRVDEQSQSGPGQVEENHSTAKEEGPEQLRVLIVDDSPMMRKILSSTLTTGRHIKVVGMAGNGEEAIALIDELSPDLITLDVNMPVMDGASTIKHIMIKKPGPVVITSNPGEGSSKAIFNFLELGAVDFMSKPTKNQDILLQQQKMVERVRTAAAAKVSNFRIPRIGKAKTEIRNGRQDGRACRRLTILISGPGGHPEQMSLFSDMVPAMNAMDGAVVAIQSLPPSFADAFARYLFERCGCPASSVGQEQVLSVGHCFIGIHGSPLTVSKKEGRPVIGPADARKGKAPVDRLLSTTAEVFGKRLTVVLLSGANTGDRTGIRAVNANGGKIILRERSSCMVAAPLDPVAEADLASAEVDLARIVKTVSDGFRIDP
jgi:two-component system chemotaxis response regulator CheB